VLPVCSRGAQYVRLEAANCKSMSDKITVVSGFGRCGSSMVMQMLYAGGMPIDLDRAKWPYIEDSRQTRRSDQSWVAEYAGSVLKWLEPSVYVPPTGLPFQTIWLDRDLKQQAKSHVKFNRARGRADIRERMHGQSFKQFMDGKRERRPAALEIWRRRGPVLIMRYEGVKNDPLDSAKRMAEFTGHELDIDAMVAAVVDSQTKCRNDMLEVELREKGLPVSPQSP